MRAQRSEINTVRERARYIVVKLIRLISACSLYIAERYLIYILLKLVTDSLALTSAGRLLQ